MKKTSRRTGASRKPSRKPPSRRSGPLPFELALAAFADLAKDAGLRWYVFGAQAVNLHGFPRATADLDITVELGRQSVGQFVAELARSGFDARFVDHAFLAATHVIPAVHRASGLPIDFVLAGPGLEELFLDEVVHRSVGRRNIPMISLENLVVTKVIAGRPRDVEDVRELLAIHDRTVDYERISARLHTVEQALDQSDLRPRLRSLRPKRPARKTTS